ncbi:hypothetical protein [Desulfosporosinus sp. BG]|uniref:hypothetical protein n=1 Tax=Desulfosporosinus sp. BG TaxID=1633135 RepID=UPI00083B87EC|nr:hypothetical protein [Desulfosporosinus sp. BG]ODA40352.1 hypothetical protein DSBG_2869 [Desulfosporosinus sp. BG]
MSKLKLMYDVVNTMKDKEAISGALKVEGMKDQTKIVNFINQFEKNLSTGETKVKLSTELDYDGKKVKHESQTEFTMQGCQRKMHPGFMRHMRHHHHSHHCAENYDDLKCGGIKGKLTKLAFVLNLFNQIKMEEKDDKSVILSLNLNEIPEDMKKAIQERMSQRAMSEHQQHHHGFMKEFFSLQEPKIELNLWISENREVKKILVTVDGKQMNDLDENHNLNLKAELCLFS